MGKPTKENLYSYQPSLAVAIVFTALSAIWLLWHFYLSVWLPRSRIHKHRYTIPLLISTILSTTGWGMRAVNTFHLGSVNLYGNSSSYIVIAPIFVCASLYLLLKYLVNLCLPHGPAQTLFGISPRWLGRIFIASDVFSFLMQGGGSGISASGNWEGNLKEIGVNVLLAGLGLQLATFTFYLVFLWTFVCRVHRTEGVAVDNSTKKVLVGMWIASVFVQVSSTNGLQVRP